MAWVIRTKVPPMSLSAAVQEQLRQATGLPVADIRPMSQIVARSTSREQFNTLLMTVFAASALSEISRRLRIKAALVSPLDARRSSFCRSASECLAQADRHAGMRLAILGVMLGVVAAFELSRYMTTLLFGVERGILVFVGVPMLLAIIALLAVWIPAGRASRIVNQGVAIVVILGSS
jgi:hypothetical protein